ncbi:MAG: DUF1269 domain-containing protein [Myxococcota bacterium]
MSELIAVAFEDRFKAEEVLLMLRRMQAEYLIDLEDAAIVTRREDGKVKINQTQPLVASGAVSGGFWGVLLGAMFLAPGVGMLVGAASGALAGALSDVGIADQFMKDLGDSLPAGGSALFVLVRKATPDKVLEALQGKGGKVLTTSLSHNAEARLQDALDAQPPAEASEDA